MEHNVANKQFTQICQKDAIYDVDRRWSFQQEFCVRTQTITLRLQFRNNLYLYFNYFDSATPNITTRALDNKHKTVGCARNAPKMHFNFINDLQLKLM